MLIVIILDILQYWWASAIFGGIALGIAIGAYTQYREDRKIMHKLLDIVLEYIPGSKKDLEA